MNIKDALLGFLGLMVAALCVAMFYFMNKPVSLENYRPTSVGQFYHTLKCVSQNDKEYNTYNVLNLEMKEDSVILNNEYTIFSPRCLITVSDELLDNEFKKIKFDLGSQVSNEKHSITCENVVNSDPDIFYSKSYRYNNGLLSFINYSDDKLYLITSPKCAILIDEKGL